MTWSEMGVHMVPKLILDAVRASSSYHQFVDLVGDRILPTGTAPPAT